MNGKWVHRLSDHNVAESSAFCRGCGRVVGIYLRPSDGQWMCRINKNRLKRPPKSTPKNISLQRVELDLKIDGKLMTVAISGEVI